MATEFEAVAEALKSNIADVLIVTEADARAVLLVDDMVGIRYCSDTADDELAVAVTVVADEVATTEADAVAVANDRAVIDSDNEGKLVTETDLVITDVAVIEAVADITGVTLTEADAINDEAGIADDIDALVIAAIDLVAVTGTVCTAGLDDNCSRFFALSIIWQLPLNDNRHGTSRPP